MNDPNGLVGVVLWAISWVMGGGNGVASQGAGMRAPSLNAHAVLSVLAPRSVGAFQPTIQPVTQPGAASAPPALAARTVDQYADLLIEQSDELKREEYKLAEEAIRAAGEKEPGAWKWKTALAAILSGRGEHEQAMKLAGEAVKLSPESARAWYWHGQTKFMRLAQTQSLSAFGEIDDAKASLNKAVELDAGYAQPRMALGMFYIEAPGIAGGSVRKAKEQGNALLKMAEPGPYLGHVVLARCAVYDEKWTDAEQQFTLMEAEAKTQSEKASAASGWARVQIIDKDDPKAGLVTLERAMAVADGETQKSGMFYLAGEAKRKLKDLPGAIESYRKVLELKPDARLSRWALAECLEQTKQYAAAAEQYSEFATRFPSDDKAGDAVKKAGKLVKKK